MNRNQTAGLPSSLRFSQSPAAVGSADRASIMDPAQAKHADKTNVISFAATAGLPFRCATLNHPVFAQPDTSIAPVRLNRPIIWPFREVGRLILSALAGAARQCDYDAVAPQRYYAV